MVLPLLFVALLLVLLLLLLPLMLMVLLDRFDALEAFVIGAPRRSGGAYTGSSPLIMFISF